MSGHVAVVAGRQGPRRPCDGADADAVHEFVQTAIAAYSRIDILVNTAGVTGPIETLPRTSRSKIQIRPRGQRGRHVPSVQGRGTTPLRTAAEPSSLVRPCEAAN